MHSKDNKPKARADSIKEGNPLLDLPDADRYIISAWRDMGLVDSSAGELSPLSFTEIKSYSDSVQQLDEFECSQIRIMSREYMSEKHESTQSKLRSSPLEKEVKGFVFKMREHTSPSLARNLDRMSKAGI